MKLRLCFIVLSLFLFACGGSTSTSSTSSDDSNQEAESTAVAQETAASPDDPVFKQGETVYSTYCIVCHMADGNGVPNLNPPLGGTDWVNGDTERLISLVLNGRTEPLEINGTLYTGVMTPHNFLSDEDIAAVLTFVRASFGNSSGPVKPEEVTAIRAKQ